jgi:hypothetical protein
VKVGQLSFQFLPVQAAFVERTWKVWYSCHKTFVHTCFSDQLDGAQNRYSRSGGAI